MHDHLTDFIDDDPPEEWSLAVVNRTRPQPVQEMVESLFDGQPVAVSDEEIVDCDENAVILLRGGEVVASSALSELEDTILFVNSDLYVTGARSLGEIEVPDVISWLENTPFRLRGFPESDTEKLPLILLSRFIEQSAYDTDGGRLRSSFQRLSRIEDERGTRNVYHRLADTDVDVHVYGIPDWIPPETFDGTIHAGYGDEFRNSWFVVYDAPDDSADSAALVAYQVRQNEWLGEWTFDDARVSRITRYLERNL
ncbi:DICT sensory domain-containing protein [Halostella litorea]|uniref:DICT sensory domain-containing protein n=1 Tax=Halostella litorea TaxID=2528831 RepID=UPI001091F67F|nr:DICT sensory domain-containing protein [Halostella litorea]